MSMYQIISVKTPPVVAKDAPSRRIVPPVADLEATLAAMKADAAKWKKRKEKAWGEILAIGDEALARKFRTRWTADQLANLETEVVRILSRNPPMSRTHMETLIRGTCNRHKLRDVLTKMHSEGAVKWVQVGSTEKHWSLA